MKTNRLARRIRNIRNTLLCLAIAALPFVAFTVGGTMATRVAQSTVAQTETPQAPNVDISGLMAALR